MQSALPCAAGSYLAACVAYATLFKVPPGGLKHGADSDSTIAKHLQTVAWRRCRSILSLDPVIWDDHGIRLLVTLPAYQPVA